MVLNELLDKMGLKFEELSKDERATYQKWLSVLESHPLNVEDIKSYIKQMREIVSQELVDCEEFTYVLCFRTVNRKHVGLKARLKNYLLLEAFLESKERAKKALESRIEKMTQVR